MRHGTTRETIRALRRELQSTEGVVLVAGSADYMARVREALDPHELERVRFEEVDRAALEPGTRVYHQWWFKIRRGTIVDDPHLDEVQAEHSTPERPLVAVQWDDGGPLEHWTAYELSVGEPARAELELEAHGRSRET